VNTVLLSVVSASAGIAATQIVNHVLANRRQQEQLERSSSQALRLQDRAEIRSAVIALTGLLVEMKHAIQALLKAPSPSPSLDSGFFEKMAAARAPVVAKCSEVLTSISMQMIAIELHLGTTDPLHVAATRVFKAVDLAVRAANNGDSSQVANHVSVLDSEIAQLLDEAREHLRASLAKKEPVKKELPTVIS